MCIYKNSPFVRMSRYNSHEKTGILFKDLSAQLQMLITSCLHKSVYHVPVHIGCLQNNISTNHPQTEPDNYTAVQSHKILPCAGPHYDGWHLPIVPVPLLVNNYFIHRFTKYLLIKVSPVLASGVLMPASYRSCPREM